MIPFVVFKMEVVLVAYTPNPEELCAKAMRCCRSAEAMHKLKLDKPAEYYIALASQTGHLSVLEHASFTFSVKDVSRVTTHQLVRHRIASYSQQSFRSVQPKDICIPESIKQNETLKQEFKDHYMRSLWLQQDLIEQGIPTEDFRYILPQGMLTNIVITMNARELLHFFELRLDKTAQWEIRGMAELMLHEVQKVAPNIFKIEEILK